MYNRGIDKKNIFNDKYDIVRFFQSMEEFNTIEPIGSIYENSFIKKGLNSLGTSGSKLVNFIAYCLNPNHYHFILEQKVDCGVSKFMGRLSGGYTKYFNKKNKRGGFLFQGPFKVRHVNSNDYLLHLSAYVNLNNHVHKLGDANFKNKIKSSWEEYTTGKTNFCKKDIVLDQFKSVKDYETFASDALDLMIEKKKNDKEIAELLLE